MTTNKQMLLGVGITLGSFVAYVAATWLHTDLLVDPALGGMAKLAANVALAGEVGGLATTLHAYTVGQLR